MEPYLSYDEIAPPKTDEFELTFFGPGFGESIVVYIPGVGWGIIDSCEFRYANQKFVPPLEYLKFQGVNNIAFLILTHPHLDHYKGMDQIIEHYIGKIARICLYAGDGVRELTTYLTNRGMKGIPGAKSLASVFRSFQKAKDNGAEYRRLGAMTQVIRRQQASINGQTVEVEVLSLSPSAEDMESYVNILRDAVPEIKMPFKEIPDYKHNLIASAVWISVGEVVVILGSDVEKGENHSSGWRGIVRSADTPDLCAKVLKVPHHGSPNAYYNKAWKKHCKDGKITSIITPFNKGHKPRPSKSDIERIGNFSNNIGLTSHISYLRSIDVYVM